MLEAPLEVARPGRRAIQSASEAQVESEGAAFMSLMGANVQGKVTR